MKVCPICSAVAFDDAATCFGCLYDYSAEKDKEFACEAQADDPACEMQVDALDHEAQVDGFACGVQVGALAQEAQSDAPACGAQAEDPTCGAQANELACGAQAEGCVVAAEAGDSCVSFTIMLVPESNAGDVVNWKCLVDAPKAKEAVC